MLADEGKMPQVAGKGPAPAPAPAVAVKFPGGHVDVGQDGVHVAFPGGAVNVAGRKLQQTADALPLLLVAKVGTAAPSSLCISQA